MFDVDKRILSLWLLLLSACHTKAQDLSYSKIGNSYFRELENPVQTNLESWSKLSQQVYVSFADDQVRYAKEKVPLVKIKQQWKSYGWRGERIHTQILVWAKVDIRQLHFTVGNLVNQGGKIIKKENLVPDFVRYVLSDTDEDGCSHGFPKQYDSTLVADPIDLIGEMPLEKNTVRPIWLSLNIPSMADPGKYSGKIIVHAEKDFVLDIEVEVSANLLPPPSNWIYHLDLWQYPAPIAKMHGVEMWSDAHFELMKPYYKSLANAGQKVITANIIAQPWGMNHVHFEDPTLVKWIKKIDGSWIYDFSLFDRYVQLVMDCGISQQINCYSMLSWDGAYLYEDEALGNSVATKLEVGSAAYIVFWKPMMEAFTTHLKEKKWFSKTVIAMDERPLQEVKQVIALLKEIDPLWKIALSTDTVQTEIADDIYDYSLASYLGVDFAILQKRKLEGKRTTFYTACMESSPGPYTFSAPAENTWLAWYAAAKNYDGYLFWAFNSWVKAPLLDARWRQYPSGTLFQFYPGPRSSIRFEKLIEGVQDFEKIRILRTRFEHHKEVAKLKKLNDILGAFNLDELKRTTASQMLSKAKAQLNRL
jgi:Domain of unknown function (DUF4091)